MRIPRVPSFPGRLRRPPCVAPTCCSSADGRGPGAFELLQSARRSIERLTVETGNSEAIPILTAVLLVYFCLSFPLAKTASRLERSLAV